MSNVMWHVALEPGTTRMQDVIVADIEVNDLETITFLLATNQLKGKVFETERGGYMLMYGGEYERPFPSIIIWKLQIQEDESIIKNMQMEDAWILKHVWREWLMPEETDAEYVPPKQFLVMERHTDV